jgi:hypothetical protein
MTWTCGRQRIRIWQWPLFGLLLVASFLGHDLLMAGEVLATPQPGVGAPHHGSGAHASRDDTHPPQTHEPAPEHPANCHIGQRAVPRSDDPFAQADQELAAAHTLVPDAAVAKSQTGTALWEEPRWPPGTLRALFQVYRI